MSNDNNKNSSNNNTTPTRINPHTQKKARNPPLGRRLGNKCTYSGNGGALVGFEKGLRIFFKKYVHLLNAGPKYVAPKGKQNKGEEG